MVISFRRLPDPNVFPHMTTTHGKRSRDRKKSLGTRLYSKSYKDTGRRLPIKIYGVSGNLGRTFSQKNIPQSPLVYKCNLEYNITFPSIKKTGRKPCSIREHIIGIVVVSKRDFGNVTCVWSCNVYAL